MGADVPRLARDRGAVQVRAVRRRAERVARRGGPLQVPGVAVSAPDIQIVHGDSLEISPETLALFDAQITDFPYSPHVHENAASVGVVGGGMGAHARDLGFGALTPELRAQGAIAAACVKRWSVVFSDWQGGNAWDADASCAGAECIRWVPWIRWSQPQLSGDRPCTGSEAVLLYHAPGRKRWNGPGSLTHYERRCLRGRDKHPTEKPIDLLLDLVSAFSDPGEMVVDLCAGAGTTALACRLLGRGCYGWEIDARWAATAAARVLAPLTDRDRGRAEEWCVSVTAEAEAVPAPKAADGSDVKTWERAQRRLADVSRVVLAL